MAPTLSSIFSHSCTSLSCFSPFLLHCLHFRPFRLVSAAANLLHHSFPTVAPPPIRGGFASRLNTTTTLLSTKNSSSSPSIRPVSLVRHLSSMNGGEEAQPVPPPPYDDDDDDIYENDYVNDWHIVMEPPEGDPTKDEIIDSYIKTLMSVVGCDEEHASWKMITVSTKYYYAFSADISERHAYKMSKLANVRTVIPDYDHITKSRSLMFGEAFDEKGEFAYADEYYEEHKKMLLEGNYNIEGIPKRDTVCPPNMRGFFPKICELEYWHVVMEPLDYKEGSRDHIGEIINGYIKTLATIIGGSEEEASMRMRSVSTKYYYSFEALFSWREAYKMNELPNVKTVLPTEFMWFSGDRYSHDEDPKYYYDDESYEWKKKMFSGVNNNNNIVPSHHRGISLDACDLKRRYDVLKRDGCKSMDDPTRDVVSYICTLPNYSNDTEEEDRRLFITRYRYAFGAIVIESLGFADI